MCHLVAGIGGCVRVLPNTRPQNQTPLLTLWAPDYHQDLSRGDLLHSWLGKAEGLQPISAWQQRCKGQEVAMPTTSHSKHAIS